MKQLLLLLAVAALGACATQDGAPKQTVEDVQNQAVQDFIEVRGLQGVDKIRSTDRDGWDEITWSYIVYRTRRTQYLVEFSRPCYELRDNREVTPDIRANANIIRAKFETLRGCRIARIFEITPDEAVELKNIGEAPGKRN